MRCCQSQSSLSSSLLAVLLLVVSYPTSAFCQQQNLLSTVLNPSRSPSIQLSMPLHDPAIRTRAGVTDEAYDVLKKCIVELEEAMPKISIITEEKIENRINLFEPYMKKAEEADLRVWGILSEVLAPADMDILMGIYLGIHGLEGIYNPRIAERLQITNEQMEKIRAAFATMRIQKRELASKLGSGKLTEEEKMLVNPNEDVAYAKVSELLSRPQKDNLDKLLAVAEQNREILRFGW